MILVWLVGITILFSLFQRMDIDAKHDEFLHDFETMDRPTDSEESILPQCDEVIEETDEKRIVLININDPAINQFEKQSIDPDFTVYQSFKDFEKAFREYQKESLTTFCTVHNTRDFSKDGKNLNEL